MKRYKPDIVIHCVAIKTVHTEPIPTGSNAFQWILAREFARYAKLWQARRLMSRKMH
jgi:dTDP-4-dehydrorhamnose reductase